METDFSASSRNYPGPAHHGADDWKKYLAIAGIAMVVMIAGAVIGAGVTVMYFGQMFLQPPGSPDQAARLITARIDGAVDLSSDERVRTRELVRRRMDEIAAIRKKYEEEVNQKLGNMSEGITGILGAERSDLCGDWMRHYRSQASGESAKKKMDCCCEGNDSECDMR